MEKLDKPLSKDYGPLVIWASDLEELFSELEKCKDINFVADDVKYESVEEFITVSKGRNPQIVKIKARDPYIDIELYHRWARLYVSSSELLASGLFLKIDSILSRCERKPRLIYRFALYYGISSIFPAISFLPPLKPYSNPILGALLLTLLWFIYVLYIHMWHFSTIRPMHREERPGFFRRNADSIVIAIIAALLGAVVGVAATKMADKLWPSIASSAVVGNTSPAIQPPTSRPSN